jgi:hypothetical protein
MRLIEFRSSIIGIGIHGAVARHGKCISGGRPGEDRCIGGGGVRPLGGDLDASGGAQVVVGHHFAVQGVVRREGNCD